MEVKRWTGVLQTNPIPCPLKECFLVNTPLNRFLNRYIRSSPFIDELYHENSKWTPRTINFKHISLFYKSLSNVFTSEVTQQYVADSSKGLYVELRNMPKLVREIIKGLRTEYLMDFYLLIQDEEKNRYFLYRVNRGENASFDFLIMKREIPTNQVKNFLQNEVWVHHQKYATLITNIQILLLIVGNMQVARLLYGNRGYRVLLIKSGYVAYIVQSLVMNKFKRLALITPLFHDNFWNNLLDLDGVDFAVLNLILIKK